MGSMFKHGRISVPIRDIDEKTRHLIPPKKFFILENEHIEEVLWAIKNQKHVLFVGEPGVGKSELVMYLCSVLQIPLVAIQGDGEQSVADLVGFYTFDEEKGGMVWKDGKVPYALRNRCSILCDEINTILPEVNMKLHSALDDRRILDLKEHIIERNISDQVIEMPETIEVPDETTFFATMNPHDTGRHVGTKPLSPALESRFHLKIPVSYLSEGKEIELLTKRTKVDKGTAKKIVEVANKSREAFRSHEMGMPIDHRMTLAWAELAVDFGMERAIDTTVLSRLNEEDFDVLRGLLISYGITKAVGRE